MKVYEDAAVIARAPDRGAAVGHITIEPKKDASYLEDLPPGEAVQLFFAASFSATAVFEGLGAQGTNIVVREGEELSVDVLPRSMEDGLGLRWDASRGDPGELDQVASKVKEKLWYVGRDVEEDEKDPAELDEPGPEKVEASPEDNYKLRQLDRTP